MKYILLLIIVTSNVFAQKNTTGLITYSKHTVVEKDNQQNIKEDKIANYINSEIEKLNEKIEYTLKFNIYSSIFNVVESIDKENKMWRICVAGGDGDGVYFDNIKTKTINRKITPFNKTYFVVKSRSFYNWKLYPNVIKKIGKYTCYKATCIMVNNVINKKSKNITAWYCPQIPVSFGPVGFSGLPGLILELNYNNKYIYNVKYVNLDKKQNIQFNIPKNGEIIQIEQFEKIMTGVISQRRFNRE